MHRILIVEADASARSTLNDLLISKKFNVTQVATLADAEKILTTHLPNLIIGDLKTSEVQQLAQFSLPILITSSQASLKEAVELMKAGATDYLAKPFNPDDLLTAITDSLEKIISTQPAISAKASTKKAGTTSDNLFAGMLGNCSLMTQVFTQIEKVASFNTRVLILGESGTGKELVARALHTLSPRNANPFIPVNCAAIPETLIEAELFGYERGAFTGATNSRSGLIEAADGGTLFLDEIGELPLEAQARLLRVLQEKEVRRLGSIERKKVDLRLVAATHRNLPKMIEQNRFRLDLYYRLNVIEIELPKLADRDEDLLLIAEHLLAVACESFDKPKMKLSKAAKEALLHYSWPGNVRELENKIERAVILSTNNLLQPQDFALPFVLTKEPTLITKPANFVPAYSSPNTANSTNINPDAAKEELPENLSLEDYFVHFVLENEDTLSETALAKKLGISRKCLWERRQKFGIPRRR